MQSPKRSRLGIALALTFTVATSAAAAPAPEILALGEQQFTACVACHGPDGKGIVAGELKMAPSLHESAFVKGSPEVLALLVLKGVAKENDDYVQQMLALESVLDDEKLAALLSYVRHEFGGLDAKEITPGQTKKWRARYQNISSSLGRTDYERRLALSTRPSLISDLQYALYDGKWEELPDFSKLEPAESGPVTDNLIDIGIGGRKNSYGLVFKGTLNIPETDNYEFRLASDDGARLSIDGEGLIDKDGIHPADKESKEKIQLDRGLHTLELRYFDRSGQKALSLVVEAKKGLGGEVPLSSWVFSRLNRAETKSQPIPLKPLHEDEAILYRNFIKGPSARGIAVGYPGEVNLCWDAEVMNLDMVWRGAFMDASLHWTSRGSGSKAPEGVDVVAPARGLPLQVLDGPEETWVPRSETKVRYERDEPNPKKEITIAVPHPDYRFRGYRLDKQQFPTFLYEFQGLTVEDTFQPTDVDGLRGFVRTVKISGKAQPGTHFRIAEGPSAEAIDGWLDIHPDLKIKTGSTPLVRPRGKRQQEVLVPIDGDTTLTITYAWKTPLEEKS